MKTDPRVDAYVAKAAPFAQPLLVEVRERIHKACPDATETIKWNVPFYELSGKLLASMAAFKKHVKLGVWHDMRPEMVDVTALAELPSAVEHAKKLKAAAERARLVVSKPAAKKAPAEKAPGKKAPAKKAPAKKAPAKKAPAKKAPAKKALPARSARKPRTRE
jgi:hypothetical protein